MRLVGRTFQVPPQLWGGVSMEMSSGLCPDDYQGSQSPLSPCPASPSLASLALSAGRKPGKASSQGFVVKVTESVVRLYSQRAPEMGKVTLTPSPRHIISHSDLKG